MLARIAIVAAILAVGLSTVYVDALAFNKNLADRSSFQLQSSGNQTSNSTSSTNSTDPCATVTCQNGGSCITSGDSAGLCACPVGYDGALCQNSLGTVLATTTSTIAAGQAATLSLSGSTAFSMVIPVGALPGGGSISLAQFAAATPTSQPSLTPAGAVFQFTPRGQVFATPITVTFPITAGIEVPTGFTIKIFKYDVSSALWVQVGGSYDPSTGTCAVELSSFSQYTPMVVADPSANGMAIDGHSDNTIVWAIVVSILVGLFVLIGGMLTLAYYKNKQ
jgi:hypothetical protein